MACYLTHDTANAELEGKHLYPVTDIISNLSSAEIQNIRAGYVSGRPGNSKVAFSDQEEMDAYAFKLGFELQDWTKWYDGLSFAERKLASMKTIEESYHRGVRKRVAENPKVDRLCIFIQGPPGIGKTHFARLYLPAPYIVDGGQTGKYDELTPAHQTLVINDYASENIPNLADDYMTHVYRRGSDNPYWCGDLLVVTSNYPFDEWLVKCGLKFAGERFKTSGECLELAAVRDRFYVTHVDGETLVVDSPSKRGLPDAQRRRLNRFIEFKLMFEEHLRNVARLKAEGGDVDYSVIDVTPPPSELDKLTEKVAKLEAEKKELEAKKRKLECSIDDRVNKKYHDLWEKYKTQHNYLIGENHQLIEETTTLRKENEALKHERQLALSMGEDYLRYLKWADAVLANDDWEPPTEFTLCFDEVDACWLPY